jgi:broad specificity polyphosphatase/5'/3'-nucleotidase SurE
MKLLVVISEPISAAQLRDALPDAIDPHQAEVMVVAPALQQSALQFWLSDADDAIAKAEAVRRETLDRLGSEGVAASGDTGEADPAQAIQDALQSFPADRVILFTHAGEDQRYREEVDASELAQRFGVPVERATVSR